MSAIVAVEPVTSGSALLKTSVGEILIELWPREAPKACRNFVQLALEGYYDGLPFHRIVPGFIAQTGDATGTGTGGESIYDEGEFEDEFSQRLKFNRRGLLGMANQGRNTNLSQFFFTLDRADELYQRNTMFARVAAGDTLFNVLKLGEVELEPGTDRPVYPPKIHSIKILDNPFDDIVPRITPEERKEQDRAKREMRLERAKQKQFGKRKGTKNKALLSFGAEPEEEAPIDPELAKAKFKSAHDVLDDARLSKEVIDDRGTSATLPEWMQVLPSASSATPTGGKKTKDDEPRRDVMEVSVQESKLAESTSLRQAKEQKAKAAANPTAADKVRDEIAKVQADLKRMARDEEQGSSDEDERERTKAKKPKRSGPSLLQLEREKYQKAGAIRGKGKPNEEDMLSILDGFKNKLKQARPKGKEKEKEKEAEKDRKESDERYGIDENDDSDVEDWMSHKLVFRKDATLDQHTLDEYSVVDPLAKETASLAELQEKKDSKRRYPGDHKDERDHGGRGGGGGRSDHRARDSGGRRDDRSFKRDDGGRGGGRGGGGGGAFDRLGDRPEVRGDWKQDRMRTSDLA